MRILVVGYGYVGKAMVDLLTQKYGVDIYDPAKMTGIASINEKNVYFLTDKQLKNSAYDLAVICVPTPMLESGECNTGIVLESMMNIKSELYLIKSTVTPGTTSKLTELSKKKIVFSPEYVGESKYHNPYFPDKMIETPFTILGGAKEDTSKIIDILLPILGPAKQYLQMTSTEAEIVKYMENTFFATKITYCQEMFDLCEAVGADWNTVREGWLADPRINPMHTAVFRDDRGFGGKCLPKDTNALAHFMKSKGVTPLILDAVLLKNKIIRKGA